MKEDLLKRIRNIRELTQVGNGCHTCGEVHSQILSLEIIANRNEDTFEIGDLVVLKGGSPVMTVYTKNQHH